MRSSFLCLTVLLLDYSPAGNLQITKVIIMDSGFFFLNSDIDGLLDKGTSYKGSWGNTPPCAAASGQDRTAVFARRLLFIGELTSGGLSD